MNYEEKKAELLQYITSLLEKVENELPTSQQIEAFNELIDDIRQDYYSIVVVGEFKHGKSTFVNALLSQNVMPVDVTPTTALIHAVFFDETPQMHVVKRNGEIEKKSLSLEILQKYTASFDGDHEDIKYLKIFLPAAFLKERVVLVDTPGLNDLNKHRSEITHRFIPRADVVVLMLDMTAPLKKSEQEFLQKVVLKQVGNRIIYVANFMDRLDEEEIDDVLDLITRRIEHITGQKNPLVFPVSAQEALEGKLLRNEELLHYSGILEIEQQIKKMIKHGSRGEEKLSHFTKRLENIIELLLEEINTIQEASQQSLDILQDEIRAIQSWFEQQEKWEMQIQQYLHEREEEIQYLVKKSVIAFEERVRSDIKNKIELFQGSDIKVFVESHLPSVLHSHFTNWIEQYSDYIYDLLRKLEMELSKGLTKAFKQTVRINVPHLQKINYKANVSSMSIHTGNASVKAGLLVGGASTIALLMGASFIVPILGAAGFPLIYRKIADQQLENIKPELIFHMDQNITNLFDDFKWHLECFISQAVKEIKDYTLKEFHRLLQYMETIIKEQITNKQEKATSTLMQQTTLEQLKNELQAYLHQLHT
jgi:GTPase Era involved in 16S rRNA processing